MSSQLFGPNTKLLDDFRRYLESFPWFTRIETPHANDSRLARVRLDFILNRPVDPWNGAVVAAETQIDRHIIDSARISGPTPANQVRPVLSGPALASVWPRWESPAFLSYAPFGFNVM
jgi:hypothetical protein